MRDPQKTILEESFEELRSDPDDYFEDFLK
jgi:hypothetical protein